MRDELVMGHSAAWPESSPHRRRTLRGRESRPKWLAAREYAQGPFADSQELAVGRWVFRLPPESAGIHGDRGRLADHVLHIGRRWLRLLAAVENRYRPRRPSG